MTETLNQQIAKLLGWHVERDTNPYSNSYILLDPQGAIRYRSTDAGFVWDGAPDIEHSLDACSDALPHGYDITILSSIGGGYSVIIRKDNPPSGYSGVWWGGGGATRAEAMAEALYLYLLWKTQQEVK